MIATSRSHRALVDYDRALRTPLAQARRIAVAQLQPGCGATTTARQVAAAFARRRSDGDVVVTDWGVRRDLVPVAAASSVLCLVAPAEPVAVASALDALAALPEAAGAARVLALVELDPVGWALRCGFRMIREVPTVMIGYQPALRLAERHRPARLPYAYRVGHLRLAAALMADAGAPGPAQRPSAGAASRTERRP